MKFLSSIDTSQYPVLGLVFENIPFAPPNPQTGRVYFDTVQRLALVWDGLAWRPLYLTAPVPDTVVATTASSFTVDPALVQSVVYNPSSGAVCFLQTPLPGQPNRITLMNRSSVNSVSVQPLGGVLVYNSPSMVLPPNSSITFQYTGTDWWPT